MATPGYWRCKECKSDNVALDATAKWNAATQKAELLNVMDKGHRCDDCGGDEVEWVLLPKEERI